MPHKDDLQKIYDLIDQQKPHAAVDILFRNIDTLLRNGQFDVCDGLIKGIDLQRLDTNLIVALLSITLPAADKLPYRPSLFTACFERLSALAPDRVERLVRDLR